MPSPRLAAALAAAATSLILAAPAAADSISYIKDGNVWLTSPDGARQFQVTSTGAYAYASQADDGTFVALAGERLHRLDRMGNVLADFATPVSDGAPPASEPGWSDTSANYFHGPFDPEISPDGTKVSYTYYWQHYTYDYVLGGMRQRLESGTAITHPDRLTAWDEFGGNLTGWVNGSWVDNDTLMRANAGVPLAEDIVFNDIAPGGGGELRRWYRNDYGWERKDPELNRQQTMLALSGNASEPVKQHLAVYRLNGGTVEQPEPCFAIYDDVKRETAPDGATWSPDGLRLGWQDSQGIWTLNVGDQTATCHTPEGEQPRLLVPGAKHPDWGPADVPAGRPAAPAPAAPQGGKPGAPGKPGAGTGSDAKLAVKVTKASVRQALGKGLRVKVTAPAAGKVTATALKGAKTVARGAGKARQAGPLTLKLKFDAKGKRALRGAKRAKLRIVVKAAGARRTVPVTLGG